MIIGSDENQATTKFQMTRTYCIETWCLITDVAALNSESMLKSSWISNICNITLCTTLLVSLQKLSAMSLVERMRRSRSLYLPNMRRTCSNQVSVKIDENNTINIIK